MKAKVFLLSLVSFGLVANAAIYVPPVEEQVPSAEIVVVGTLSPGKDVDGEHRGRIVVSRVLHGSKINPKDTIDVRWKPKPKKPAPGLAHTADYVFAPQLKIESVFVIQPKQDSGKPHSLNWGTQYPAKDETNIKKLVAKGMDFDFVGKTEAEAIVLGKKRQLAVRVTMRDGKELPGTDDLRSDRLNLTILAGKVARVNRG